MRSRILYIMIMLVCMGGLFAQVEELEPADDIIQVHYEKKSAATAMLLSALFPGAGQFYADPSAVTAYIFPVIEIGLWYGFFMYNSEGADKEDEYMRYADEHYNRSYYAVASTDLMNVVNPDVNPGDSQDDIYNEQHFRLDSENTQHYYEDIGKYSKYIFGWEDWYAIYADPANGPIDWVFDGPEDDPNHRWIGNYPTHPDYGDQEEPDDLDSFKGSYHKTYVKMRGEAEDSYAVADNISFMLVANHLLAALDAIRVTRNHNADYISQVTPRIRYRTAVVNQRLTPMITISARF